MPFLSVLKTLELLKQIFTHVGDRHSYRRDVQQFSHRCDLGQGRRYGGRAQHYDADDNGGHAGGQVDTGFQENRLAEQQHHVYSAELLPGDHGTGDHQCLNVAAVGEQFTETRFLLFRLVHGVLTRKLQAHH